MLRLCVVVVVVFDIRRESRKENRVVHEDSWIYICKIEHVYIKYIFMGRDNNQKNKNTQTHRDSWSHSVISWSKMIHCDKIDSIVSIPPPRVPILFGLFKDFVVGEVSLKIKKKLENINYNSQ